MTLLQNDPVTQLAFSLHENKGVYAVLLGSGLSRSAEIPTGWEITLDLVRRVATAQGVPDQTDWAAWYREKTGNEPNYSVLLEDVASSPDERRAVLHRYIEPDADDREAGRKLPTKAHHAIAELVKTGYVRVIITTNFDRLMENALREKGVEPTVVSSADALAGAEPLTHSKCYLLKLHGDYKDARILNTGLELSSYPDGYSRLLDRIFDEHGLVICGWSGEWDHALRAALLRAPNRRYPVYWATRGALGSGAQELATHRRARPLPISGADELFETLAQRVETLEQSQRQNPLSVELLVQSAKRFLAKPEHRIQLDDLFSQETDRLLEKLNSESFFVSSAWSQSEFRTRVERYESLTEPLARMAGLMGRWGGDKEFELFIDLLRSVYHQTSSPGNGLSHWLNLRSYPAVLLFTAYGIGLTKSSRWPLLLKLFSTTLKADHREPVQVVSTLFLWSWEGGQLELWRHIEGLDRHKTPLSDHLLAVMTRWRNSFVGTEPSFELLFERFELMGSLAALQANDEAELEKALAASPIRQDPLAWMPVGRAGWNNSGARTLLQELEEEPRIAALMEAGFANSSRRFLQLFAENFKFWASRMRW